LVEGAAGLEGCCIATVLGFQAFSWAWASAGADLKKLKLNMVTIWDLGDGKIERGGSSESWWSGIDKGEERSESLGDGGMRD
jgi:hypothetical protein